MQYCFIFMIIFFCNNIACSQSIIESKARQKANEIKKKTFLQCNGKFYVKRIENNSISFTQFFKPTVLIEIEELKDDFQVGRPPSQLEAKNGLEWQGTLNFFGKFHRYVTHTGEWSKYQQDFFLSNIVFLKERNKEIQTQFNNQWIVSSDGQLNYVAPTNCGEIQTFIDGTYKAEEASQLAKKQINMLITEYSIFPECDGSRYLAFGDGEKLSNPDSATGAMFLEMKPAPNKAFFDIEPDNIAQQVITGINRDPKVKGYFSGWYGLAIVRFNATQSRVHYRYKMNNEYIYKTTDWQNGSLIPEVIFNLTSSGHFLSNSFSTNSINWSLQNDMTRNWKRPIICVNDSRGKTCMDVRLYPKGFGCSRFSKWRDWEN